MFAGGIEKNNGKRRLALKEGTQILVHSPASQNGTGVLGIGWIVGPHSPPFAPGVLDKESAGEIEATTLKIKQKLKEIYANPKNCPVKWRPCDRKGEPTGERDPKVAHYSWDFGQQWARERLFKTCQDRRYFHFKVRWEATVPWYAGVSFKTISVVTPLSEVGVRWVTPDQHAHVLALLSSAASVPEVTCRDNDPSSSNASDESELMQKLRVLKSAFDQGLVTLPVYEKKQMQLLAEL